jgi:hypothetical protein
LILSKHKVAKWNVNGKPDFMVVGLAFRVNYASMSISA